jgi:hypothetical protein
MSVTPGQMQSVLETSGSYQFAPSMGETVLYSYGLCGIRRAALTQQHFEDARIATNLMMGRWSSQGVNLWQVDSLSINLVQGTATYQVPSNTIVILDAYVTINSGGAAIDRIITPISRSEYASYSNKQRQGSVTVFWFDRLLSPTITLWLVPDGTQSSLTYYRLRQTQDSVLSNGTNVEIPYYFLDAFALGLAYRLALSWAPDRAITLKPLADEAWSIASTQNTETANTYISPQIGQYFR